jgi:hypothetical protein
MRHNLMRFLPVWPQFHIEKTRDNNPLDPNIKTDRWSGFIGCNVRRKAADGNWYHVLVIEEFRGSTEQDINQNALRRLIANAYKTSLLFQVDTTAIDRQGNPIFRMDIDEREEADRVISLIPNDPMHGSKGVTKGILTRYSTFLEEKGYLDSDWRDEQPSAPDRFIADS